MCKTTHNRLGSAKPTAVLELSATRGYRFKGGSGPQGGVNAAWPSDQSQLPQRHQVTGLAAVGQEWYYTSGSPYRTPFH
jgi:hypothetical protein